MTIDIVEAVLQDLQDGMKIIEVAHKHNISRATVRRYRNGKEKSRPRVLQPCGTDAAYKRHKAHGEQACLPCCDAHRDVAQEYRDRRKK